MVHHVKSIGASTASVLSPRSISYSLVLVFIKVFWVYFPSIGDLTCNTGLLAFQRQLLLEYGGGPEKDRDVCVFVVVPLRFFSPDLSCQLDVPWHNGDLPGMDSTQIAVLEQTDKVSLRCFLETQYSR